MSTALALTDESLLERLGEIGDTLVSLDFETFYSTDYSLSKLTTEAYVRDERFEVLGVGVKVNRGATVWLEEWEFRRWCDTVDWSRVAMLSHHAHFDGLIMAERYDVRPAFHYCTMSMGRALHGEGALEKLAIRHGLGPKGDAIKSGRTKGKRRRDLTQREWQAFGDYCRLDVDLMFQLLELMGPKFPALEFWLVDSTIRMFTEPVFSADLDVLRKALTKEREKKRAFLTRVAEESTGRRVKPGEDPLEVARATLSSADKFAALLRSMDIEPQTKPNKKGEQIWAFAKTDPGMAMLLEHERDEVRFLAEARLAVKSTIIQTRVERLIGIAQRGKVPFYLKYSGAHTHRWSGGDKMNPQNFNRGGDLRGAIIVEEDEEEIVVADSGQIEARVLPWLAGETKLVDAFRRNDAKTKRFKAAFAERVKALGHKPSKEEEKAIVRALEAIGIVEGDYYSDVGSDFFLKRVSKAETPIERQLSKNMILGLGFNMGWGKFALELLKGMLGSDPVQFTMAEAAKFGVDVEAWLLRPFGFGGGLTCRDQAEWAHRTYHVRISLPEFLVHCAVAAHFVGLYRTRNPRITALWKACEEILRVMERPEGDPTAVRMRFKGLEVMRHAIRKPSGLVLRYPGLRKSKDGYTYLGGKSGREVQKIYGGLLTENLVQSLARDIVAEQALRVRADGVKLATTTHDEIVAVVPHGRGEAALEQMIAHMRTPPAWCRDLPLNAEGGFGTSYGAVK